MVMDRNLWTSKHLRQWRQHHKHLHHLHLLYHKQQWVECNQHLHNSPHSLHQRNVLMSQLLMVQHQDLVVDQKFLDLTLSQLADNLLAKQFKHLQQTQTHHLN
jgi:hypothetical protein